MTNEMQTLKELSNIENDVQKLLDRVSEMLHDNITSGHDANTSVLCSFKAALISARVDLTAALGKFEL